MNKIMSWYSRYYLEISWFIIGWLVMNTVTDFGRGDWPAVALDLLLIFINYMFARR